MNIDTGNLEAASAAMLDERLPWESLFDEVERSDYIFTIFLEFVALDITFDMCLGVSRVL